MTVDKSAPFTIPTIDISPYLQDPSSPEAKKIIEDVRNACMTTGFFSLVGHGISKELQERVFNASKAFFALPLEEKRKLSAPPLLNRGYEQIGSQALQEDTKPDMKEGFYIGMHVSNDDIQAKLHPEMVGENIFPPQLPAEVMKEPTEQYYKEVFEVGCKVMEILAKGLPYGDDIFKEFLSDNPICALRLLHYPPQVESDEKQLGAGAHTDFGAITLLLQDDAGGLEVLNNETGDWVPVEPNADAYVVNIGDMLAMWTKNIYKSNTHRVINKSTKDRYSLPFFFDGAPDVKLAPFDGSEPVGGKVLTVEEHMLERFGTTYGRAKVEVAGA
ncbi:2og-Fe oxygenase family protein [Coniochaeta sp. PMI_546]|nr:2og-Fe oxygenase family protein [Coniochaeta sp. PMI_546]